MAWDPVRRATDAIYLENPSWHHTLCVGSKIFLLCEEPKTRWPERILEQKRVAFLAGFTIYLLWPPHTLEYCKGELMQGVGTADNELWFALPQAGTSIEMRKYVLRHNQWRQEGETQKQAVVHSDRGRYYSGVYRDQPIIQYQFDRERITPTFQWDKYFLTLRDEKCTIDHLRHGVFTLLHVTPVVVHMLLMQPREHKTIFFSCRTLDGTRQAWAGSLPACPRVPIWGLDPIATPLGFMCLSRVIDDSRICYITDVNLKHKRIGLYHFLLPDVFNTFNCLRVTPSGVGYIFTLQTRFVANHVTIVYPRLDYYCPWKRRDQFYPEHLKVYRELLLCARGGAKTRSGIERLPGQLLRYLLHRVVGKVAAVHPLNLKLLSVVTEGPVATRAILELPPEAVL